MQGNPLEERRTVMLKGRKKVSGAAMLVFIAITLLGCVAGRQLATSAAEPAAITGTYTLLLYGCHYPDDIKNVAILVNEGGKHPFEIYDLDTSYKVEKHVPAQQAFSEANSFLKCTSHRIWRTEVRRISDDAGGIIGYEVRPLYVPYEFGIPDVLLISYSLRNDGTVRAYIRLDPDVERAIEASGSDESPRGGK